MRKEPYPKIINELISAAAERKAITEPNANGRDAAFLCGVSIEFRLRIDDDSKRVDEVGFSTNGCGYVVAVAETLADGIEGAELIKLEGLTVLEDYVGSKIGEAPDGRHHCFNVCFDALQNALADYRKLKIAQWNGDDALVCSCFGVSESQIEQAAESRQLRTVKSIGEHLNAGTGCGSCQPIIQEILDDSA